jgi:hypothetical protein
MGIFAGKPTGGLLNLNCEAFPKLPVLGKQPWNYGKKRALDRFFKSVSQN